MRLTLPRDGDARVDVLDAGGRVVTTLFAGRLPAGASALGWDPRVAHVAAGVYTLRLRADAASASARVIITR